MKTVFSKLFQITDQVKFSIFSGDYNPMHIDEITSRRFLYGKPVVHGINLVLNALEVWTSLNKNHFSISYIETEFLSPVFLDKEVSFQFSCNDNINSFQIFSENNLKANINFQLTHSSSEVTHHQIIDKFPEKISPKNNDIESLKVASGDIRFYLNQKCLKELFPNLFEFSDFFQIASLLSSTRLVGMECPGMNSIFSSFNFNFSKLTNKTTFKVIKTNRFGFVTIEINGGFNGTIKAFLRPEPVEQLDYNEIKKHIKENQYKNQVALVIGGSRGIGEVTAKILAAGNAEVVITYNKGINDAQNIINEVKSNGGKISMIPYDVNDNIVDYDFTPTDIYYFATPPIFSGIPSFFSSEIFNQFSLFYLSSFYSLVKFWSEKKVYNFFYPSSVYVNEMPNNMLEYSLAKHSAEKMCDHIMENNKLIKIYKPKLPRLATDQTVSFLPVKNNDPFKHMLTELNKYIDYKSS